MIVKNVIIGIPQGSVLRPILCVSYINDLHQQTHCTTINMFADDVSLYTTGQTVPEVNDELQGLTKSIGNWYEANI